jgi:hypothetical protein
VNAFDMLLFRQRQGPLAEPSSASAHPPVHAGSLLTGWALLAILEHVHAGELRRTAARLAWDEMHATKLVRATGQPYEHEHSTSCVRETVQGLAAVLRNPAPASMPSVEVDRDTLDRLGWLLGTVGRVMDGMPIGLAAAHARAERLGQRRPRRGDDEAEVLAAVAEVRGACAAALAAAGWL